MTEMEKQALMEIKEDYCKRNCKYTPVEQEVMCEVKDIFWDDEEEVVQIHPRKSQYVNITEAFHLWRPANGDWEIMNDSERVKE